MKHHLRSILTGCIAFLITSILPAATTASAQTQGVTGSEIIVGSWGPLTGPVAPLGTATRDGARIKFEEVNAAGGIFGRKLRLISYDDGASPQEALPAVRRLIYQDQVFMLLLGSTSGATLPVVPLINQAKIPFIAGASSNVRLLQPFSPYIYRPYPNDTWQAYRLIDYIVEKAGSKRPAVIYVSDDFGKGAYDLVKQRLADHFNGMQLVAAEQYNKGDQDYSAQLLRIKQANPDALGIWALPGEAAIIVRQARQLGITVPLYGAGPTVTPLFASGSGDDGIGYIAQYFLPYLPEWTNIPAIARYTKLLHEMYPGGLPNGRPSQYDFQGFGAASVLIEGLKAAGKDLTREKLLNALDNIKHFESGLNMAVTFSKDDHEGNTAVSMVRVNKNHQWEMFEK
jgi:branched-chain amino acid transport system substrate-binding protein